MTVVELVDILKANDERVDAIARIVGYAVMIQRLGGMDKLPMNRISRYNLEKTFRLLGVDPATLEI